MAFIDDLKYRYRTGSMLMRLIYVNIAVFVVFRVLGLVAFFGYPVALVPLKWIEVSSNAWEVLVKPWTLITYAFAHYEIMHILFNMLWLYWLGRIFMEYFNAKQLTALYIYGALGGAALYLAAYNLLPVFHGQGSYMLGASASVIAIVVATATYAPDYRIGLLFIGAVSLKWVAIVTVGIDLLSIDAVNPGGHIAHLGGALVGVLYGMMMKRGHDITAPLNAAIDSVVAMFSRLGSMKKAKGPGAPVGGSAYRRTDSSATSSAAGRDTSASRPGEKELDEVLAKIKRSGYTALTPEERDLLFSFSRKDKK